MKALRVTVVGLVLVGAVSVAWNSYRAARDASDALAAAGQTEIQLEAKIRQAETRLAAVERAKAGLRSTLDRLDQPKAAPSTGSPLPPGSPLAQAAEKKLTKAREFGQDPNAQLARLAQQRGYLTKMYRPLFPKLGLSPAEAGKFIAIGMREFERRLDLDALTSEGIAARHDPAVAKLKAETKAEAEAAYREMLGESGYRHLQEYDRTFVARDLVMGFAGVAVMAGSPFTAPQLEPLVQIIANASSRYRTGKDVGSDDIDWDVVDGQVRPLMTEAQWTLWKTTHSPTGEDWAWSRVSWIIAKAIQAEAASKRRRR